MKRSASEMNKSIQGTSRPPLPTPLPLAEGPSQPSTNTSVQVGSSLPSQPSVNPSGQEGPSQPSVGLENEGGGTTGDSSQKTKKIPKARTAPCWKWFKLVDPKKHDDGTTRAECIRCGKGFMADSSKNGTTNLNNHLLRCPKRGNNDISQMMLQACGGKFTLRNVNVSPASVRELVLNLVVKHELPLRFVEYDEFRNLMFHVYPEYTPITRNTLLADVHKAFNVVKKTIKDSLISSVGGRVSVTTDLWTSITNDGYMTLTAHYIDQSWVLHTRLLKFTILTPPHNGANISEGIRKVLVEWGLEGRLFSITVDNASANDVGVCYLIRSLNAGKSLICGGDFFHVRCYAHILNIVVQDGIKLIDAAVQKVRDSVKFVKSSQSRKVKFKECCDKYKVSTERGLHGDVSTRWNSTFQMIEDALHYRFAFENLSTVDSNYKFCPEFDEWEKIRKIAKLLKPFDEVTKVLSGSKYPTSNLYFLNVVQIHLVLNDEFLFGEEFMENMIHSMREKFNKYWSDFSLILSVAVVLDPRYKMDIVKWAHRKINKNDPYKAEVAINRVFGALSRLYGEYKSMPKEQWSSSTVADPVSEEFLAEFLTYREEMCDKPSDKDELDLYLQEKAKPHSPDYDVLAYWKSVETQYPDLSRMARDILAIPVSTVASESSFSAGGRVIDKYRSRLLPDNAEALICLRDWMYDVDFGDEMDPDQDAEDLSAAMRDVFAPARINSSEAASVARVMESID